MKVTKRKVLEEMMEADQHEIFKMEIVRDFNKSLPESETTRNEIAKATVRIEMCQTQIEWLKNELKSHKKAE